MTGIHVTINVDGRDAPTSASDPTIDVAVGTEIASWVF
jgi:hypothetical protein